MNLLGFRSPDRIYYSDSCPAGLGGYSDQGFAWRFRIPDDLQFRASNNLLEFLAAVITPWIDIIDGRLSRGDCALSMTDSTTAEGWMRKSNFSEPSIDPIQATTRVDAARKYAEIFMSADVKGYSQWFPGKKNNVADALSREWQRTNDELTSLLREIFPKSDARPFRDITSPQRNQLLADITAAAIARERAVTGGTHDGEARAWRRWTEYCKSVGCTDFFMDQLAKT